MTAPSAVNGGSGATAEIQVVADAIQSHRAIYQTQYDGRGGVAWKDDGGLLCSCGVKIPRPEGQWIRPWNLYYRHVAEAALAAARAASDV